MRRTLSLVLAALVAALAMVTPPALSIYFAWRHSVNDEKERVAGYAQDVLRRSEEARSQMDHVFTTLRNAKYAPCSPQEIELMGELDLGSGYVQAVGRIDGDRLICSSLGKNPIAVGAPNAVSSLGVVQRVGRRVVGVSSDKLNVYSENGFAVIVDQALLLDTPNEGGDLEMAIFLPSSDKRTVIAATANQPPAAFLTPIVPGARESYVQHGRIVALVRSGAYDLEVVATVPRGYADRRVRQLALVRFPLGILCGLLLAGAVVYLSRRQLALPARMRGAVKRHEFFVEYQPVVSLETGRWHGAEALVRWRHGGNVVSPERFIPAAEEEGVITAITAEVMDIVAKDLPGLLAIDPEFDVGINLSAADMCSERTLERLDEVLAKSGAPAKSIYVEATERGFLQDDVSRQVLQAIRERGFLIAIDDFGTGYSSLSKVQSLALDALKIDKAFVETIGTDGATSGVVLHIIEMAKSMGLVMVAEGVETEAQAEMLRRNGVQYAQGWLFSRPLDVDGLKQKLREQMQSIARGRPAGEDARAAEGIKPRRG